MRYQVSISLVRGPTEYIRLVRIVLYLGVAIHYFTIGGYGISMQFTRYIFFRISAPKIGSFFNGSEGESRVKNELKWQQAR